MTTAKNAAAAASADAQAALMGDVAARYLSGIPDAQGVNLLYAGTAIHGQRGPMPYLDWSSTRL